MAEKKEKKQVPDIVTREQTLHMSKRLFGVTFKQRAPRAIREIKKAAEKLMKTKDVRIDAELNKYIWSHGVKNVPKRIRLQFLRNRNEDEDAKEQLYTLVKYVPIGDRAAFRGLQNV